MSFVFKNHLGTVGSSGGGGSGTAKLSTTVFGINNTMNINNGKISPVNEYSFVMTNYNVSFTPAQWKKELIIQLHLKTPSSLSNQWIMSNADDWNTGIGITINPDINNAFWVCLGQSDTSKAQFLDGTTILQTDTEYWVRVYKPNTENEAHDTLLQISTDGVNWTTEDSVSIANIESNYTTNGYLQLFNLGGNGGGQYFQGSVYFEDTFISVDGEKIWYLIKGDIQ